MVGYDGSVKVLDFGIAKAEERATKTVGGTIKGKYGYMSPEQCKGKPIDRRSDIFALGIVLYELTTLRRAFKGNDDFETMKRITPATSCCRRSRAAAIRASSRRSCSRRCRSIRTSAYQNAGAMGRELEGLAAALGLPLGHAAITDVMTQLFAERRRRFAPVERATSRTADRAQRCRRAISTPDHAGHDLDG